MKENNYLKDLKRANQVFFENIAYFKEVLNCNDILSVEEIDNKVLKLLDMKAGIDLIIQENNGRLRTVANRVHSANTSWDTFTIRYKRKNGEETEYDKRIFDIENDYLYPHYTIQSYISEDTILNYDIVKTKDLYKFVEENFEDLSIRTTYDGNKFIVIPFDKISHISMKGKI